jgi:hypothetical protein
MCYLTHLIVLMILNIKKVTTFAPVKKKQINRCQLHVSDELCCEQTKTKHNYYELK